VPAQQERGPKFKPQYQRGRRRRRRRRWKKKKRKEEEEEHPKSNEVIPALGSLRQEDHKFKASLGYTVKPYLKHRKKQ
jgi:hypothetical protein